MKNIEISDGTFEFLTNVGGYLSEKRVYLKIRRAPLSIDETIMELSHDRAFLINFLETLTEWYPEIQENLATLAQSNERYDLVERFINLRYAKNSEEALRLEEEGYELIETRDDYTMVFQKKKENEDDDE